MSSGKTHWTLTNRVQLLSQSYAMRVWLKIRRATPLPQKPRPSSTQGKNGQASRVTSGGECGPIYRCWCYWRPANQRIAGCLARLRSCTTIVMFGISRFAARHASVLVMVLVRGVKQGGRGISCASTVASYTKSNVLEPGPCPTTGGAARISCLKL